MRIAVLGSGTNSKTLPAHLAELATADVTPALVDPRLSVLALSPYERLVVDVGYVDAAQAAERDGFDAVFNNSFADYGIAAARAALGIPVVGAGEATLRAAAEGGRRFAIVTVWPRSMAHLYDERLRTLGLVEQCIAIEHVSPEDELARVGLADGVMARMDRGERGVIGRLDEACERVVKLGAEAIALGCTCMAPVGPALAANCRVPVLESSRLGFRATVEAARRTAFQPASGARTPPDLIPALVDAWVSAGTAGSLAPTNSGDCPVCVVSAD
jgi:allantoin racemase